MPNLNWHITDDASLKHLTNGEPSEEYNEDGDLFDCDVDTYYCMNDNK